jgi:DNA-binding LacI/PurR family transcriptional regulator
MPTLCKAYSDEAHAREAVDHLLASGAPRRAIRLLTGSPTHDVRDERVGTFADAIDPDAPVGRFAGPPRVSSTSSDGHGLVVAELEQPAA